MLVAAAALDAGGAAPTPVGTDLASVTATATQARGMALPPGGHVVATQAIGLAPGMPFAMAMDWATGQLQVSAATQDATAQNGGHSGCHPVTVGWATTPPSGSCGYQQHPGGVHVQNLLCSTGTYCYIDAYNLGWPFGYSYVYCDYVGVAYAEKDWDTGAFTQLAVPGCVASAFGVPPPAYAAYDSFVEGNGAQCGINNGDLLWVAGCFT